MLDGTFEAPGLWGRAPRPDTRTRPPRRRTLAPFLPLIVFGVLGVLGASERAAAQEYPGYPETGSGFSPFESAFLQDLTNIATAPTCNVEENPAFAESPPPPACQVAQKLLLAASGGQLRSVAPEQFSVENSLFKDFAGTQLQELANRLTSLRQGASGFQISGLPGTLEMGLPGLESTQSERAHPGNALGGGASADELPADFGRWGGFLNVAYDWGRRENTDFEDAFHAHTYDFTVGADYRLSRHAVIGAILGYADSRFNFEAPPDAPGTGGELDSKGYSLMLYLQEEWDAGYVSVSVGDQLIRQNMQRLGVFTDPYNGYDQTPFDAQSSPHGNSLLGMVSGGYDWRVGAATIEPYATFDYRDTRTTPFSEHGASGTESNGLSPFDVDFTFAPRSVTSAQGSFGVKLQYVLHPSFGVIVPYVDGAYTHEFNYGTYNPTGMFTALYGIVPNFVLPADPPTLNFGAAAAGFTLVAPHGVQAYLRYREVIGQRYVSSGSVAAGFRVEL